VVAQNHAKIIVQERIKFSYLEKMTENQKQLQTLADQILTRARELGVDQAEVTATLETGFSATARQGDVETLEHHQNRSLDVTVYREHRAGTVSTSDFSLESIQAAVQKACSIAKFTGEDPYLGLPDCDLLAHDYPDLHLYHPWNITPKAAIDLAISCETSAVNQDKRINHSEGATVNTFDTLEMFANSSGFFGTYQKSEHSLSCSLVADENGEMAREHEYTLSRDPSQLLDPQIVANSVVEKTLKRLGSKRLKTQRCPVIFHAPVAKTLLGHFVSAITGVNLYRGISFLLNQLEKPIFPNFITIHQNPHAKSEIGSVPFDSDGVKTKRLNYVEDGALLNYSLGTYSGRKLGMKTTGNSGGVHNLVINHADKNLQQLLRDMGTGLLVTELIGQGVSIVSGNYSRGAFGFWVENGEIQYPVHEITIASNLKDMFKGIQCIANDVDHRHNVKTGSILLESMMVAGE